ncbi:MAG: cysteine desulfurase family protein [Aestuariivirga sp.]|nr:cysteine desulfurase family protein [Aestuariivirga sp.]
MRTYLDHNATSHLRPAAKEAMCAAMDVEGNASSVHREGRLARKLLDDSRETIARGIGVIAPMISFTSGGSEANNLAIKSAPVERLLVSAFVHPAVMESAMAAHKPAEFIPVTPQGVVDLEALAKLLEGPKALVSVMLANNETGVIQPLREIVALAQAHGALVHTDAVQAFGKMPVNFGLLGVDMMTIAAHKIGGPTGIGALVVRDGLPLEPLVHGGGQELRRRAGTENLVGIAGFAAVAKESQLNVEALQAQLEEALANAVILGGDAPRLPNTTYFSQPGMSAETLLMNFDLEGIAVSSGSACSSGKVTKSHVLTAMNVAPELAKGAIRVSLGWNTTQEHIEHFIAVWRSLLARHKAKAAA